MNIILLYLLNGNWMIEYDEDSEHGAYIYTLFNTTILPTPYTDKSSPELVLKEMQNRNPEFLVKLL